MLRSVFLVASLAWSMSVFAVAVENVTLLQDDGGKPGAEVDEFAPSDKVQHFKIELDETKVGAHAFVVEFWAVKTDAASNVKVTDFKTDALIANVIDAQVSLPRNWPVGEYRLDVKMDGVMIGSFDYEVSEP